MKLFSVLDAKTGGFSNPFCGLTNESAIREFSDAVNDERNPNNQWARHPEDFVLYCIGDFDSDTAAVKPMLAVESLVNASALRALKRPEQTEMNFNGREMTPVN